MADLKTTSLTHLQSFFANALSHVRPHLDAQSIQLLAAQAATRSIRYAQDHPYHTAWAALNVGLMPVLGAGWLTGPLLKFVGFGSLGPIAGTAATWYQSTWLGPYIPAGSAFAMLQKWAMTL